MKPRSVDLNSDVGEHSERELDASLMSSITSANIASNLIAFLRV